MSIECKFVYDMMSLDLRYQFIFLRFHADYKIMEFEPKTVSVGKFSLEIKNI